MINNLKKILLLVVFSCLISVPAYSAEPAIKFKFSNKDKALAQYNIAVNYAKRGELPKAIEAFQRSADLDPDNFDVYYNMGVAYSMMKEYEAALKAYSIASTKNPKHSSTYYNMAVIQADKQDLDSAKQNYLKAIECEPNMLEAHANLALIYLYKKDTDNYQKEIVIIEKLDPDTALKIKNISSPKAAN